MIIGGYVLHLYCDAPDCGAGFENTLNQQSLKQALEEAGKAGWSVGNNNGGYRKRKYFCPAHRKRVGIDKWGKRTWITGSTITT